ncbi:phosphoesterase family-domain-containing protein [Zopfochytrium polystomum]|nr:phosphoesterase family-domain-containing protein [Zopfochytrium polystomum]
MLAASLLVAAALAINGVAADAPVGKWFDHYVFVILENEDLAPVIKNDVFGAFAKKGLSQTNYHGVAHPSQPNYWATIAGNRTFPTIYNANTTTAVKITGDNGDNNFDVIGEKTIAHSLADAGISFKVYSEDYPTPGKCYLADGYGDLFITPDLKPFINPNGPTSNSTNRLYKRKHNPFLSFPTYYNSSNPVFCAAQQNFPALWSDLLSGSLPQYAYIVPNQLNDDHDTTVDYAAAWFEDFIAKFDAYAEAQSARILLHVTYDEDDTAYAIYYNDKLDNAGNPNPYYNASANPTKLANCTDLLNCTADTNNNKVYSVLAGSAVKPSAIGTEDDTLYSHYSILKTLQQNWGLPSLGKGDVDAAGFSFASYASSNPDTTPSPSGGDGSYGGDSGASSSSSPAAGYYGGGPATTSTAAGKNDSVLYSGAPRVADFSVAAFLTTLFAGFAALFA